MLRGGDGDRLEMMRVIVEIRMAKRDLEIDAIERYLVVVR